MSVQQYHYVVRAKIIDGEFAGWFIDYDTTEAKFPNGNMWTSESIYGMQKPDNRIDNNLILDLGARLMDEREITPTTKSESNLPPW